MIHSVNQKSKDGEILDIMQSEFNRLSQKSTSEMTESFRNAYAALLVDSRGKPFLNWLLLQAPVHLLPCSAKNTAFAATDGNMYVNPVFWSAIVESHNRMQEKNFTNPQSYVMDDLGYLVTHEMGHLMLRHPWSGRRIVKETAEAIQCKNESTLHGIANLCMDFVVNAGFCSRILPNAVVLKKEGITDRPILQSALDKIAGPLPDKIKDMFNEPDLEQWGWDDIFRVVTSNLPKQQLDRPGTGRDPEAGTAYPGEWQEGKTVRGTHGEILDSLAYPIREGGAGNNKPGEDGPLPEERWRNMAAEAVAEARSMGTEASNMARLFEGEFEVKVPWETLVRERLASHIGQSQTLQSWTRNSRRHADYPGIVRTGGRNMWLLADVSGSISKNELDTIAGISLSYLKRSGGSLRIVFWDTDVCADHTLHSKADLQRISSVNGGGGTVIGPALEHVLKNAKRGDSVCVCTDSAISDMQDNNTKKAIRGIHAKVGPLIWFHLGNKNDLKSIQEAVGTHIRPVAVDAKTRLVDRLVSQKTNMATRI